MEQCKLESNTIAFNAAACACEKRGEWLEALQLFTVVAFATWKLLAPACLTEFQGAQGRTRRKARRTSGP